MPRDARQPKPDWLTGTSDLKGPVLETLRKEGACHAHGVVVRLQRRFGSVMKVEPNEVYGMLKRLHAKELLDAYYGPNPNNPREQVLIYQANDKTVAAVAEWLDVPVTRESNRTDLLMRFSLMDETQTPAMLRMLDEYERDCAAASSANEREIPTGSWPGFVKERTRKAVVGRLNAELDWIDETRKELVRRARPKA